MAYSTLATVLQAVRTVTALFTSPETATLKAERLIITSFAKMVL